MNTNPEILMKVKQQILSEWENKKYEAIVKQVRHCKTIVMSQNKLETLTSNNKHDKLFSLRIISLSTVSNLEISRFPVYKY